MTMGEAGGSAPIPGGVAQKSVAQAEFEAFQEGLELGKEYAGVAARRVAAWAEENPGQVSVAGVVAGFSLGKLLFRAPRRIAVRRDLDLD